MAARTIAPKLGTFVLDVSTNGVTVNSLAQRTTISTRYRDLLKGEGGDVLIDRATGYEVALQGTVVGSDSGDATTKFDDLLRELHNGEQYFQYFDDRRILVGLTRIEPAPMVKGSVGRVYRWRARMRSRSPYPESVTSTTENFAVSGVGPHVMTFAASIDGDAPIRGTLTITTNVAFTEKNLTITSTASDKQIILQGLSLASGQTITLDFENRTLGDGISVPIHPQHIHGSYFDIVAGVTPTIELAHTVGSSANWTIQFTYRDKFYVL